MEVVCHRAMMENKIINIGSNSNERIKTFKHVGPLLINPNSIHEEIKCRLKSGNSSYYSNIFSSRPFSYNLKIKMCKTSCAIWT